MVIALRSPYARLQRDHIQTVAVLVVAVLSPTFGQAARPLASAQPHSAKVGTIRLVPSGFLETIGTMRSAETADNVATDFGSIPLGKSSSDALFSMRHSRFTLRADSSLKQYKLTAYAETDFLNPPGRFPWRVRQVFGQMEGNGWQLLAGQAWSLMRANQRGVSSLDNLIDIDVIDPAFHVGLVGGRRQQVRIAKTSGAWTTAVSYESQRNIVAKVVRDSRLLHLEGVALSARQGKWAAALTAILQPSDRLSFLSQQFVTDGAGSEVVGGGPEQVKSYSTIEGVESTVCRGIKLFAYSGLVYNERSKGNRIVREWTLGASKTLFAFSGFGAANLAGHFSQVNRTVWQGQAGEMHFVMLSLRYTVP